MNSWSIGVIVLVGIDLLIMGWGLNPGIPMDFYDNSQREDLQGRIWIPAQSEYDLKFEKYFRFDTFDPEAEWEDMKQDFLPNLPMLQGVQMVNNFDPMIPGEYQVWMERINDGVPAPQLLELMNVSGILEVSSKGRSSLKVTSIPLQTVRIMGCEAVIGEEDLTEWDWEEKGGNLLENGLVITEEPVICEQGAVGNVEILVKKNGYLKVNADLDRDGWVMWSQTWYPGWLVRVDGGKYLPVNKINFIFMGVGVPGGNHVVEFIYRPGSFVAGGAISVFCAILSLGLIQYRRRTEKLGRTKN